MLVSGRVAFSCFALLVPKAVVADPPPGGTPPPVTCEQRAALKVGTLTDGKFVGEVPMKKPQNGDPGRWFHQVVVTVEGGKLSTYEMPGLYVHGE